MKLTTYLNFAGTCEEAFQFYEKHLGAKIESIFRWSQMPDAAKHTPPGMGNKVLHGRLDLGDTQLMAADVPGAQPMRSAYLSLAAESSAEAERIYAALSVLAALHSATRFTIMPSPGTMLCRHQIG